MLDGDGYVCRFSFAGGNNVHFLSRYVQTRQAFLLQHSQPISALLLCRQSQHQPGGCTCRSLGQAAILRVADEPSNDTSETTQKILADCLQRSMSVLNDSKDWSLCLH